MNQQYEPLENLSLNKSNTLISAKYMSSLVENQIMAIALARVEVKYANDINGTGPMRIELWPGELKRLIGDPTNIYKTLKKVSKTMRGHTMVIEDGKGNFKVFGAINDAVYEDGVLTIEFNRHLREHVLGLEGNYTSYELAIATRFKKNSSFRLYEILKTHLYKSKPSVNEGRVDVEYNISELRFMIGLANSDDPVVKNAFAAMGKNVDWDVLYSKLDKKDRKFEVWYDFQRYVIKPAQAEVEEKSNLRFEYEGIREGRCIKRIRFHIYPNVPKYSDVIDERKKFIEENNRADRQYELPRDLPEYQPIYDKYVGHNELTPEDIDVLMRESGFDNELVELAINRADEQADLNNYMGWIVACIRGNGWPKTSVVEGSAKQAERIKDLQEKANSNETKLRVWKQTKEKDDFHIFVSYMEKTRNISMDELDFVYEPGDAVAEYIEWKKAGSPEV